MIKKFSKSAFCKLISSRAGRMQFWILLAFLVTFLVSRAIAKWDPTQEFHYNGHHIHHFSYGIVVLALAGLISLTVKRRRSWMAALYGFGLGVVFDEFVLWLNVGATYWSDGSYDAVAAVLIVLLVGVYYEGFLSKLFSKIKTAVSFKVNSGFKPPKVNKPFVSVVIPAFNESDNITGVIKAIKEQKLTNDFEIIVADNNSSDDTIKLARAAGADLVVSEVNARGANAARAVGLNAARGEIVAFVDADCAPEPDWLEKVVNKLVNDDAVAVSGPYDHSFSGWQRKIESVYISQVLPRIPALLGFFFRKPAAVLIGGNFAAWRGAFDKAGGIRQPNFWGDDAVIAMALSKIGKVNFDPTFRMPASARRFEEKGFIRLPLIYIYNYLRAYYVA